MQACQPLSCILHREFMKRLNPSLNLPISLLIISLVTLISYANSLNNDFVFDDKAVIVENELVKDIHKIPLIFTSSYWAGYRWEGIEKNEQSLYRPLVIFSYSLNYLVNGLNPRGYHVVNLSLHLINSMLVFFFCLFLFDSWVVVSSLIVSLMFATHPIHTEAVTSIVGRAELLCFCFFVLSLLCYLRARVSKSFHPHLFYALSLGSYFLALLSKETAVTLLGVVVIRDWLYRYQGNVRAMAGKLLHEIKRSYSGFFLVTLAYAVLRLIVLKKPISLGSITLLDNPMVVASYWERILTAFKVIGNYLSLLLFPLKLSADYSFNQIPVVTTIFSLEVIFSLFLLAAIVGCAFWWIKREVHLSFSIFFFFITLFPVSNLLVVIGTIMAERLLYLPSLGFCVFVVALGHRSLAAVSQQKHFSKVSVLVALTVILTSCYTMRTIVRNRDWYDGAHLFESVVKNASQSARGHNEMATVYFHKGDYKKALEEAGKAIEIYPGYKEAHYCLGTTYNKIGQHDKAVTEFISALRIHPRYPSALLNLGISYHYLKQYERAIQVYKDLITLRPRYAEAYNNLGISYYFKGMADEAEKAYLRALELKTDYADVCKNLGVLYYQKKGDSKRGVYYLEKSLEFDPQQPEAKQIKGLVQFIKERG